MSQLNFDMTSDVFFRTQPLMSNGYIGYLLLYNQLLQNAVA